MGSNEQQHENTICLDDFLVSMDPDSTQLDSHDDFDYARHLALEPNLFDPKIVDHSIQRTPDSADSFFSANSHLDSSLDMMSGPALALEPPTPIEYRFQTPNISASARALSRLQTDFNSILQPPYHHQSFEPARLLDPACGGAQSSPISPEPSLFSPSRYLDEVSFMSPLSYGAPIARRQQGHHRDLSAASSLGSSSSSLQFEFPQVIDPSALAPPPLPSPPTQMISPFINQTAEQGPDGSLTGRYQRPLTSTGRPSHARKTPPGHVKRPRNAFILFRSHACAANLIPPTVEKDHRQISRIVSHMWKNLPAEEKGRWEREAEQEKELHRKLHPDYRYKPVYRKDGPAKKKVSTGRRKAANRKSPVSETSPNSMIEETEESLLQREQERNEALRCEVVAKILMETKLSGIAMEEGQMEARVSEEIQNVRRNDPQADKIVTEKRSPPPLFPRRKSRAISAPPPPSPIRTMHVHDVVYNPKSRGSRELSPDFPKPRGNDSASSTGLSEQASPYRATPMYAPEEDYQSAFDYTTLADLSGYEFGSSSLYMDGSQMDLSGFDPALNHFSPRRPSVMLTGLGEFPLMSIDTSSPTYGPTDDQPEHPISGLTLALPADENALVQFQNPFERSQPPPPPQLSLENESKSTKPTYVFLSRDQALNGGLVDQIRSAGYGVTYEA